MKHKIIPIMAVVAWGLCFFALPAQAKYGGGTGEPNDPYLIYTAAQMNEIGLSVNWVDWNKHFKLMADIDLSSYIGTAFNIVDFFKGVFDGNGHVISNFNYTSTGTDFVGLFRYVDGGQIKNIGLIDPHVDAGTRTYAGLLVGHIDGGAISNCYTTGSVIGGEHVGGLVGYNWGGTITNCYSTSSVSGDDYVGGLVGENDGGAINNCYATGSVLGSDYVGGLVGKNGEYFYSEGKVTHCYSTGSVLGNDCVGGLVGYSSEGDVVNSFWDIETSGQSTSSGGTGLLTAEMQMASTFTSWGICGNEGLWTLDEGNDYPHLWWEEKPGNPLPVYKLSDFIAGTGTESDPYLIYTAEQINRIGIFPCDLDKHFKLMADIDLSEFTGTSFNIIGYWVDWYSHNNKPFTGVFDGNGHTISNFTYTSTGTNCIGLFGYVDGENAEIKNLGLIEPNVDAGTGREVGSLVGRLIYGSITGCHVEGGNVSGYYGVGGLVGENWNGTITNCYATGSVGSDFSAGGLVGYNSRGTITNCYSAGSVLGNEYISGLVGVNGSYSTITNCYSTGDVSGEDSVGGLVGLNSRLSTITNSYAKGGSVSGNSLVGGLVGQNDGTISNSYSQGSVSGDYRVGGLVGENGFSGPPGPEPPSSGGTISNCYSTGSVSGIDSVGGLVGQNNYCNDWWCWYGEVWASFWDAESSGQTKSAGGIGKTTSEMQTASTFTDAGWDFVGEFYNGPSDMWAENPAGGYPILWWQLDPLPPLPTFSGGAGTRIDPYIIANTTDLSRIGHNPRLMDKHFSLTNDVNMINVSFFPIGNLIHPFTGKFKGNGNTIYHVVINYPEEEYIGFFRYVNSRDAEISGLNLRKVNVTGNSQTGALAGFVNGNVRNCSVEDCRISGQYETGGLIGVLYGRIEYCISIGRISSSGSYRESVGGLVGESRGEVSNCSSYVTVSGGGYVGGLVGYNLMHGKINDSLSIVSSYGSEAVGGLVGHNAGWISRCYSEGEIYGDKAVGGLVGWSLGNSMILECYSNANVEAKEYGAGGLVGNNVESIYNCYSTGTVEGNVNAGGLTGNNGGDVRYCYSTGTVFGKGETVGGLVGIRWYDVVVVSSFWDTEASGMVTSDGGTGLPTAEMQIRTTFEDAGWDFNTPVWTIDESVDYPRLWWETPVLHAEPKITLGTSNTIFWEPMVGARNEYSTECAEDENFTIIIYNSGWITETSYEFTGLESGKRYWYSVKARNSAGVETNWSNVESSLQGTLAEAVEIELEPESLKNKNMKNALLNKIDAVLKMIEEGNYNGALSKLRNDILQKTNGCGETGEPDKNDWIITCEEQSEIYSLIIETIEYVIGLMGE